MSTVVYTWNNQTEGSHVYPSAPAQVISILRYFFLFLTKIILYDINAITSAVTSNVKLSFLQLTAVYRMRLFFNRRHATHQWWFWH